MFIVCLKFNGFVFVQFDLKVPYYDKFSEVQQSRKRRLNGFARKLNILFTGDLFQF